MNRPLLWTLAGILGAVLLVAAGWWAARLTSAPQIVVVDKTAGPEEHEPLPEAMPPVQAPRFPQLPSPAPSAPVPALPDLPLSTLGQNFPHGFQWSTEVKAGESALTDGYEGQTGNYVFSKLTPQLTTDSEGNPEIQVQSETFALDFVGNKDPVFNLPLKLQPGVENSLLFGAPEGTYRLFVKATLTPGSSTISLETRGSFEEGEGQPGTVAPAPAAGAAPIPAPALPVDPDN